MAYSVSVLEKTIFGNKNVSVLSCTADGATGIIDTGLKVVSWLQMTPVSLSTAAIKLRRNEGTTSTSIAGSIGVTGAVSGDVFYITAFGN